MQSPLAAAFDYPVRLDSLSRRQSKQQHAQQLSTSSTASTSSSSAGLGLGRGCGRGYAQAHAHGYSSSSAHTRSSSIATDLTTASSSYGAASPSGSKSDPFAFQEDEHYGVCEQVPLEHGRERGGQEEELPRTESTLLLRERTRYRSSASYAAVPIPTTYPLQGAFGSLSLSSPTAGSPFDREEYEDDDARLGSSENAHLELLAALAATSTTLDTCFCGSPPEEDSIYCSRSCAQADALNALCGGGSSGGSSGAEDGAVSSDAASLRSHRSGSLSSGAESSHYRRIEKEETRRATEKERALRRVKSHRKPVPKQHGFDHPSSGTGSDAGAKLPSPSRATPSLSRRLPPLSSGSTSSRRSSSSCLPPSPLRGSVSSPCIVEPGSASGEDGDAPRGLGFDGSLRPCTPSPRIGTSSENADGTMLVSDIYASYLTATPRDGQHHLQTPTSHLGGSGLLGAGDGLASTPRAMYLAQGSHAVRAEGEEEEDEESPTQHCGTAGVGLRMLELCDSDEEEGPDETAVGGGRGQRGHKAEPHTWYGEGYDEHGDSLGEGGWAGGQRMQQRMASIESNGGGPAAPPSPSASPSSVAERLYGHMRGKLSFDDVVGILSA